MHDPPGEFQRLLDQCRQGSPEAIRQLISEHGDLVLRVVQKHLPHDLRRMYDSQDFVQDTWKSVLRQRSRFGRFGTTQEFLKIVTALEANKVRGEVRRRCQQTKHNVNREKQAPTALIRQPLSRDSTPSQLAIGRETLLQILAGLPPRHQEIVRLKYDGVSSSEIADRLGMNPGSVRRILLEIYNRVIQ